jgi:hypothetical protein
MYQGIVTTITTEPIPGANKIKKALCHGFTTVVGIDTQDGALGVYFPEGGRLSPRMLQENKLLKSQGGYFDETGRVRALKLMKGTIKSEGIWLPLASIAWTKHDTYFNPGDLIDTIKGELVCEKYFTPATLKAATGNKAKNPKKGETPFFRKHVDTPQLRFVIDQIPDGSLIYFTEKLHGTSGRFGLSLETVPNPLWRRMLRLSERTQWKKLVGSKNVILTGNPGKGWYTDESFRDIDLDLHKGETLYYEIVGYTTTSAIMGSQPVKDPELKAKYGERMEYRYGCLPGQHEVYVYRITRTNDDGVQTELSWPQVKGRCKELGVKHCPEFNYTSLVEMFDLTPAGMGIEFTTRVPCIYNNGQPLPLQEICDGLLEGPSRIDESHIREGICLRIEEPNGRIWFAKHKSFTFKVLEGIIKEDVNYVDREEVA